MEYNLLATTSLEKCGVVKYGKFTLKSGETSDIYISISKRL
jgi:orotate phosphoribosyltransferase